MPAQPRPPMRAAATLLATTILLAAPVLAHADAGDLDSSFDGDGKRTLSYGGKDAARAVLVQPDGKIVVAGSGGAGQDFTVSRLHPDGSLDTSFDGDGTAVADFGGNDEAYAAALQPGGEIILAGTSASSYMAVARFRSDGSLDASFDPGGADGPGKKLFNAAGDPSGGATVLVQLDGRIVLAGGGDNGTDGDFDVTRLNPDGSVDSTDFVLADFGGSDGAAAAALQPDGKIVVAGTTNPPPPAPPRMAVARYNVDGSLDATFGGTGKTTFGSGEFVAANAVQVQPDGKLVVAGYGNDGIDFVVTRLNTDGAPDATFGAGGTSTIDFGLIEAAFAALLQPDGRIVVAGYAQPSLIDADFAAARLLPGGALDATFGAGGKTTVPSGAIEFAHAAALQPDGKIVLAGYTQVVGQNVALVRLEGVTPPAAGGGPGAGADRTAPTLSRFSASPRRFRARRGTSAAAKRARRGTKLSLELSERATVRFDALALSTGRRVGTRCRAKTRANSTRKRCVRRTHKGNFSRSLDPGRSRLAFGGRVGKRVLPPGRYTLRATPKDAAGNSGKPRSVALRIVR
jgi:uncharacterized delta-60 repeat protein